MSWLKHAFAVDPSGPVEPTEVQRRIVDRVCLEIVRRRLTTPALAFLEMGRPLNYLGSQTLHFFRPVLSTVLDGRSVEEFARFLEQRGSVDVICTRIEEIEAEADARERKRREADDRPETPHPKEPGTKR